MNILSLLQKRSRKFYIFMILFGGISSIWNIGLLSIINAVLREDPIPYVGAYDWLLFIVLVVGSLISNKLFQNFMVKLTNDLTYEFGISILEKLRFASYEDFERLGKERVYTALEDANGVSSIPRTFIESFNSFIILVCCFLYLFWTSFAGGLLMVGVVVAIGTFYVVRNRKIEKDFNKVRDLQDSYFRSLNDLILGFKEVKMSMERNDILFHKYLDANRKKTKDLVIKNQIKYVNNDLVGSYSLYIVIGLVLFILPRYFGLEQTQLTAFIITILYAIGPIALLINLIPVYTRVKIAVSRLFDFDEKVNALAMTAIGHGEMEDINREFKQIQLEEVYYEYFDEKKQKTFQLGPVNLKIKKGEVVFFTGGNGSGKSTLVNIITGIYKPKRGNIYLNGHKITDENYPYYRNQIAAIFSSCYLFNENYEAHNLNAMPPTMQYYLETMQLSSVIQINTKANRIEKELSKGQQKRLALVYALLEDRPIYVFDEWAAEQDVVFRANFYKEQLKQLKMRGKTVIVVTHDADFYQYADRLIQFDYGKIISDKQLITA